MARFDYSALQGVASDVLAKFGQGTIQYIAQSPGNGPVYAPGTTEAAPVTLPGAVASVVKTASQVLPQSLIQTGDVKVVSSVVAGLNPEVGDFIVIDGVRYRVIFFVAVPAAGDPVAWNLYGRR